MSEHLSQPAGGAPLEEQPGLQRLSLFNGVFYVHQNPEKGPAGQEAVLAAAESEPEPEAVLQPEPESPSLASEPAPAPEPEPVRPVWPAWPARSAPPRGYAYEFGTGRLVRVFLG